MKKAIYDSKVEGGFAVNKRNSERVNPFHEKLPILVQWSVGLRCLISTGIFFLFLFFSEHKYQYKTLHRYAGPNFTYGLMSKLSILNQYHNKC